LASPDEQIRASPQLRHKNWPLWCSGAVNWIRLKAALPGLPRRYWLPPKLALAVCSLAPIAAVLFAAGLSLGPIPVNRFAPRIASAIGEWFGPGYEISIGGVAIALNRLVPALSIDALSVEGPSGRKIFAAPRAEVSFSPLSLIAGRVSLKRLEIDDVELRLALRPNGSLALPEPPGIEDAAPLNQPLNSSGVPENAFVPPPNVPQAPPGDSEPREGHPETRTAAMLRLAVDRLTDPDGLTAAIHHIAIKGGRIIIYDETAKEQRVFNGVNLGFDRSPGTTRFDISADGPNGRWRAFGAASGMAGAERTFALSVSNLTLDELLLAAGTRVFGVDFDMPLSGDLDIRLGAGGEISQAAGQLEGGAGYFRFDDPDSEPTLIDRIGGGFRWNPARRQIVLDRLQMAAGATHFGGSGLIAPPLRVGDPWLIQLANTEPNVFGAERPGENPIMIDLADLTARLYPEGKKLTIDRFSFSGPKCGMALSGTIEWIAGPHVRLGVSISPTPIAIVTRLWPSFVAAPVRSYLLGHASEGMVEAGTVQVDFDPADLQAIREGHAPDDSKALVEFEIKNGTLLFLPGVPALRGIDGSGRITGRTATFTVSNAAIDSGNGHVLALSDGSFHVANSDLKPVPATVKAKVSGSVEAIGELLAHDSLKPYANMPLDSSTLKGDASGSIEIDMRLGENTGPSSTTVKVDTLVSNLTAEHLIGNENLEAAALTVNVDPAGLHASGQGTMFGAPVTVAIEKFTGKPGEALIAMNVDDPMRMRLGLSALSGVTGPVAAKITAPIGTREKFKAKVELDLRAAQIEVPGISKSPGLPGKISFTVATNDASTTLDQIIVDAGPVQGRGKIDLGPGFSLIAASFPQLKLSSSDALRVDATGAGDTLKVVVRGSAIDARPFLKSLIFNRPAQGTGEPMAAGEGDKPPQVREIEFDVKSDVLVGHNQREITGAELHFGKRGGELQQFTFFGTFGSEQISSNLIKSSHGTQLNVLCENAGSLLAFLDLYNHMEHGHLSAGILLEPDSLTGVLVINNFILRDEPSLRRIVNEGALQADPSGKIKRIDTNAVAFNKLQVRFQRDGSRLALSDGTMNGDSIGLTVEGAVDYVHDIVDMKGTFVPVYSFNNIFAKIPIVGPILGGHANEGLIGVNYRISGRASAPTLSINPLSAIAPGIFRQIFGVVEFDPMNPGAR